MYNWIGLGLVIVIIAFGAYHIWATYNKKPATAVKSEDNMEPAKTRKVEIVDFNKKEYLRQVFNNTFFSIMNDDDWKQSMGYGHIEFIKERQIDRHNKSKLSLKVDYNFYSSSNNNEMTIKETELKCDEGYTHTQFKYEGPFSDEFYDYVYNIYKTMKEIEVERDLKNMENSVKSINNILGKSVERGSKLDDLLNNKSK